MKIVMLIDTLSYGGGAERQFAGLALSLQRLGYKIKVLAYHAGDGYQTDFEKTGLEYEILKGCTNQYRKLLSVRRSIKEARPDIVISYKDGPNKIACMLKIMGAKWKLIVSDRNTLQKVSHAVRVQYNVLYRYADAIVPNSFAQKEFIAKHFRFLVDKSHVITNFTDTEVFHPAVAADKDDNPKQVLVVARIARQKNVLGFIEAVRLLARKWDKSVVFRWYGRPNVCEDDYTQECMTRIADYNLQRFFEFRDPIKDIDKEYRISDIFCLPSLWEGYPNALCEAMASGLPVCASRICDNERIVEDGMNGLLFNPYEHADIASKIDKLLSMSCAERQEMGMNARQYTLKNLSLESFTSKYQSLIVRLCDSKI